MAASTTPKAAIEERILKLGKLPIKIINSPTKPFSPGSPIEANEVNKNIIDKKFQLLDQMYNQQRFWAVGSDINKINGLIKKIGSDLNLSEDNMNSCLESSDAQDNILNQRIEAQKRYKIDSTPTIFVNEKKIVYR